MVRKSRKYISVDINQFCVQCVAGNLRQAIYEEDDFFVVVAVFVVVSNAVH